MNLERVLITKKKRKYKLKKKKKQKNQFFLFFTKNYNDISLKSLFFLTAQKSITG